MTDELDKIIDDILSELVFCGRDSLGVTDEAVLARKGVKALIDRECNKARIEAFDVAFDCHDYDRLRAYRAELLKEVK